jgi:membrane-associated phospholipid phosphatase
VFFHEVTGDDRFLPLVAFLDAVPDLWTNETRAILWTAFARGQPSSISAFPSMHIAMPALFALALGRVSRRLGWALWGVTVLTGIATVVLGWHYAIDVYAAIAGAWACWWLAGRLVGWR